jgi:hypothetical protein
MTAKLSDAFNRPYPLPDGILLDLITTARNLELKLSKAANVSGLRRSEILHECSISGDTKIPIRVMSGDPKGHPVISQLLAAIREPPEEPPPEMAKKNRA